MRFLWIENLHFSYSEYNIIIIITLPLSHTIQFQHTLTLATVSHEGASIAPRRNQPALHSAINPFRALIPQLPRIAIESSLFATFTSYERCEKFWQVVVRSVTFPSVVLLPIRACDVLIKTTSNCCCCSNAAHVGIGIYCWQSKGIGICNLNEFFLLQCMRLVRWAFMENDLFNFLFLLLPLL